MMPSSTSHGAPPSMLPQYNTSATNLPVPGQTGGAFSLDAFAHLQSQNPAQAAALMAAAAALAQQQWHTAGHHGQSAQIPAPAPSSQPQTQLPRVPPKPRQKATAQDDGSTSEGEEEPDEEFDEEEEEEMKSLKKKRGPRVRPDHHLWIE